MYIDNKRSWFLHSDRHDRRTEGGIEVGNVVGVLLNLETHQLSFFVNDEQQGPVAFTDLKGVFYPALSLNRNVTVTVTSGIEPPNSSGTNSSIESEASDGETKITK
jgi:tripartite motif-containing protein 9/67